MKRSIFIIATIIFTFTAVFCTGCTVVDNSVLSEDGCWRYEINADDTICITGIVEMKSEIVIPEAIDGHTVSALSDKLFVLIDDGAENKKYKGVYADNNVLTSVTINAKIKEIPNMCFYICRNLTVVNLPNTLESIKDFAFYGCNSLEKIILPESCNSLGAYTFRECGKLNEVVIKSNNIPDIGDKCFYMVDNKASDDEQYYIIPELKIIVDDINAYSIDKLEELRKDTRNNSYKYWKEYVNADKVVSIGVDE